MRRVAVALAALSMSLGAPSGPAFAGGCDEVVVFCGAEGNGSSYTGVIAIPGLRGNGGSGGGGGGGACVGCEWSVVPACPINGPDNGADAMCMGASMACESRGEDGILMRIYVRENGGPWRSMGNACIGGGNDVVTVADVTAQAGQAYREQMRPGAARIGTSPAGRQVVNLPTYFSAGGTEPMTGTFGPAGVRMTITATPTYVWDFGDGATLETRSAGGPYPGGDVRHTYRTPATRTVTLTTRWSAEFTVVTAMGTFGPFAVGGAPVAPSTTQAVEVREARAVLVGD